MVWNGKKWAGDLPTQVEDLTRSSSCQCLLFSESERVKSLLILEGKSFVPEYPSAYLGVRLGSANK